MKIGAKIRRIRELSDLSQENVADELQMSITGYGKIERDEVGINLERLHQLSTIFKVRIEQLISIDETLPLSQFHLNSQVIEATRLSLEMKGLYEDKIKLLEDKVHYLESELSQYKK